MDNITFGKYIPINSIIHRLDPRLKLISLFCFMISIFFDIGFTGYLILAMVILCILLLSKISIKTVLSALKPMLFMIIFLMIFNIFLLKEGDVVFTLFNIDIYSGALLQTLYIFVRIALIITLTTVLTSTTKPLDLTLAIESLFDPLKRFGFPSHELAMMISIALRFIPDLIDETNRITKAQTSRGVDFQDGSFSEKIQAIVSLIIPLFISAFIRAEELANAMESRNYNPEAKRTRYKSLHWSFKDSILLSFVLFVNVGIIAWSLVI